MKKGMLLFVLMFASVVLYAQDDDMTQEAKNYRAAFKTFLKEEGFSPYIDDEDGSLCFKREGIQFWIYFSEDSPVYIEFHRAGLSGEDKETTAFYLAANDINKDKRCAKAVVNDNDDVEFTVELYSTSVEQLKGSFYRYLRVMSVAREYFTERYNHYEEILSNNR